MDEVLIIGYCVKASLWFFMKNMKIDGMNEMDECIYIVMPAYNEEDNIEYVIKTWYPILSDKHTDSRIVIADAGSTDATHKILDKLKEKYPKLIILENTEKQHGPKVISLYSYAAGQGADYVFQTDSDGQTDPEEFEMFWNMRNRYDVVLGNRQIRGDGKWRAFVEIVVCFLVKLYFGVSVPDANAPFRLMKTEVMVKYLYKMPDNYNLPNVMMTVYFMYYKERVRFNKITFKARRGGRNSIDIVKITKIGIKALKDFYLLKKGMEDEKRPY